MKKILTNLFLLFLSVSLVGCASNTQSQNTGIGAVTGAVAGGLLGSVVGGGVGKVVAVGVGAVGGALLGGYIGHSMDSTDNSRMNNAMSTPSSKPVHWTNSKTGAHYTVIPGKAVVVKGYNHCRRYHTTAMIAGKKQQVYGTACRLSNGMWKTV